MFHRRRGFFGLFGRGRHVRRTPTERIEHVLDHVECRLGITDAQRPEWNDFADMIRAGGEAFEAALTDDRSGPRSAPERLDRAEATVEAGLAILKRTRPAFERLYAVLDDGQRRTADTMLARRGGGFAHG